MCQAYEGEARFVTYMEDQARKVYADYMAPQGCVCGAQSKYRHDLNICLWGRYFWDPDIRVMPRWGDPNWEAQTLADRGLEWTAKRKAEYEAQDDVKRSLAYGLWVA